MTRRLPRSRLPLSLTLGLGLALTAALAAGCPDLLLDAPCDDDENCPGELVCDDGFCVNEADVGDDDDDDDDGDEGDEGEGEEGEGEDEGEEGEDEGEGEEGEDEGEGEEGGEGEGEEGEGEGEEGEGEDPCANDGTITTQSELEALTPCVVLVGEFEVLGGDIESLEPLNGVTDVIGSITFGELSGVDELEFFPLNTLAVVTGDLEIFGDDLDELPDELIALTDVGGDLIIADTFITVLGGFTDLDTIGGSLRVLNNAELDGFGDLTFAALTALGGVVHDNNPNLDACLLEEIAEQISEEIPVEPDPDCL